jgi:alanyl-tRNA synthetase
MLENAERYVERAQRIGGVALITETFGDVSSDLLRQLGDRIKSAEKGAVTLFGAIGEEGQVSLIGMASDEAARLGAHAGHLVKEIAEVMGGSGGGRPTLGQGGSKNASGLKETFALAGDIVRRQLGA